MTHFLRSIIAILMVLAHSSLFAQTKILILGDSISAAYGIEQQHAWVQLLDKQLQQANINANIINASISGETSVGGANRINDLLDRHQPNIVLIELGGNDGLRGYPLRDIRANLERIITSVQQRSIQVILAGMRIPPNYGRAYSECFFAIYAELAAKHQIALIPFLLDGIGDRSELMQSDGIHPTAEAQPLIVNQVWPVLLPLLQ